MDDELLELVPVFVAEARERLQRLADLVPGLSRGPEALVEIQRELHTLKGAGRMMAIAPFAELCHATEEVVLARPPALEGLLLSAHDALQAMVEWFDETVGRLLAHLSAIARDRGIARFEADVLAENKAMLVVFERSGLPMRKSRDGGVLHVTLDL